MRDTHVLSREISIRSEAEDRSLPTMVTEHCEVLERTNSAIRGESENAAAELVIATFNCRGWNSTIMKDLIEDLSCEHSRSIILACQETWRYELPRPFQRQLCDKYFFLHESAMDPKKKKKSGRPFGGISLIISKNIAYQIV